MTLQLVRILDDLPEDFGALVDKASGEGVRSMARLAEDWSSGARFQDDGEALFVAFRAGALAGVGGLSMETGATEPARRLRRVYVCPGFRRQGVASALASALIHEGFKTVDLLTVNAAASPAAGPFWEAQGFVPDTSGSWTHVLRHAG